MNILNMFMRSIKIIALFISYTFSKKNPESPL